MGFVGLPYSKGLHLLINAEIWQNVALARSCVTCSATNGVAVVCNDGHQRSPNFYWKDQVVGWYVMEVVNTM